MPRALTPKQEAFARKYVETGNAAESYKFAYPTSQKWPLTTLYPESSKMLANPKISTRIQELEERSLRVVDVSAADVVRGLHEIATNDAAPPAARVSAWLGLAKRHPEFSDKREISVNKRTQALVAISEMPLEQLLALAEGVEREDLG